MNLAAEKSLWRYAAERATSQGVAVPVLVLLAFNSFPAAAFSTVKLFQLQLGIVLAASLLAWLLFTTLGFALNRVCSTVNPMRVICVSALYAATEIVRHGTIYALSAPTREVANTALVFNLVNAATTGLVLFGLFSIALTDYSRYHSSHSALVRQAQRLQETLAAAEAKVEQTRSEIVKFVRRELTEDLNAAIQMGNRPASERLAMVDELFRIVDEVVRPLSHELSYTPESHVDEDVTSKRARVPFKILFREASIASPFKPTEVTFLVGLLTAPLLLVYTSSVSSVLWLGFMLAVFGVSWFGRKYITPRLSGWTYAVRVLVTTSVFALPVILYLDFVIAPEFSGPRLGPMWLLYALFIGIVLAGLVSISGGVRVARAKSLDELREVEAHLSWLNVRAESRLWLDQKRLALTLHSEVQGSLLAAALKLRYAIESGDDLVDQVMPEVQELVQQCIDVQLVAVKSECMQDALAKLNDTWSALIVMEISAEAEDLRALEKDGLALEVVNELMREFQINSLKHGRATKTHVDLKRDSADTMRVRLSNNGNPLARGEIGAGLGSRFLESVSLMHELRNVHSGVQLELKIPLNVG